VQLRKLNRAVGGAQWQSAHLAWGGEVASLCNTKRKREIYNAEERREN
jgi:hypothetical protein